MLNFDMALVWMMARIRSYRYGTNTYTSRYNGSDVNLELTTPNTATSIYT